MNVPKVLSDLESFPISVEDFVIPKTLIDVDFSSLPKCLPSDSKHFQQRMANKYEILHFTRN